MKLGKYTTKLPIFDLIYSWLRGRLIVVDLGSGPELRCAHWKSGFEVTTDMLNTVPRDRAVDTLVNLELSKHYNSLTPPPHYPLLGKAEIERIKLNKRVGAHTMADYGTFQPTTKAIDDLARKLHMWYLEATIAMKPESYNPNAQVMYDDLTEEQKGIDKYIARRLLIEKNTKPTTEDFRFKGYAGMQDATKGKYGPKTHKGWKKKV